MAFKVDSAKCTNCGACQEQCPAGAISEKDGKRVIDAGSCADCGICSEACPVTAITAE